MKIIPPKERKQLREKYKDFPNKLIFAIVEANRIRNDFIADSIIKKDPEVVVYEPVLDEEEFFHSKVLKDLDEFKQISDVIVANRLSDDIRDVEEKVYTRDLFESD